MKKNNGIEFLLYSYFKIELNATKDEIIKSAIKKAYTDATNQGAYNTKLIKASQKDSSVCARNNGEKVIKSFIEQSLNVIDYDDLHNKTCAKLCMIYGTLPFTYGNAQKWINMTMKNLYVISLIFCECCEPQDDNLVEFCKDILSISYKLHVPIDNFILQAIQDSIGVNAKENTLKGKVTTVAKNEQYKFNGSSWSKLDKENYETIQQELKKIISGVPIEWECMAWIEIAKKRSAK